MYPALAVLQALTKELIYPAGIGEMGAVDKDPSSTPDVADILWVGGVGGMEVNLVKRAEVPFQAIPAAGLHGVGLNALPGNLLQLSRGYGAARRILKHFQPEVLLYTGGYIAVPMAMAARMPAIGRRRPCSLLFVPDIEPGLALKTLTRFVDQIAVTAEESKEWMPARAKVSVTGYPVRRDLRIWDITQARARLGLTPDLPVLLVFGGSKGARSINRALIRCLPELLEKMQVIHISGQLDWEEVEKAGAELPGGLAPRYRAYPYLHEEIGAAMTLADLAVSRAGASVLGELPYFGLPAVLVPYPHAWRYQIVNASYLAEKGAAVVVEDEQIGTNMLPVVSELMADKTRRQQMCQEMRALARPGAAGRIAELLTALSGGDIKEAC